MKLTKRLALLVVVALVAAGCGGGGDGGGASSSIEISGSSTVEPISARVGAAFTADNPDVGVKVEGPGTGDGFRRFCAGETDISDASRAIQDPEKESCAANGVEYVELKIGVDGISVVTSVDNSAVTCLGFADLYALLGPESTGFGTWAAADALAAEVGGSHAPYPDAPLDVTAPGEESGTYDFFVEEVIEPIAEERGLPEEEWAARLDYTASANDNTIVTGIAGTDTSLGWVGFAFYQENQDKVKAIDVDGGSGCVAPTAETIGGGDYPLSRPLFIYVSVDKAAEKPALVDFVDYYLSDAGLTAVTESDYILLPEGYQATRDAWANR